MLGVGRPEPMMVDEVSVMTNRPDAVAESGTKNKALPKLSVRDYFPETWLWDIILTE